MSGWSAKTSAFLAGKLHSMQCILLFVQLFKHTLLCILHIANQCEMLQAHCTLLRLMHGLGQHSFHRFRSKLMGVSLAFKTCVLSLQHGQLVIWLQKWLRLQPRQPSNRQLMSNQVPFDSQWLPFVTSTLAGTTEYAKLLAWICS